MSPEKNIKTESLGGGIYRQTGKVVEEENKQKPKPEQRIIKSLPIEGVGGVTEIVVVEIK